MHDFTTGPGQPDRKAWYRRWYTIVPASIAAAVIALGAIGAAASGSSHHAAAPKPPTSSAPAAPSTPAADPSTPAADPSTPAADPTPAGPDQLAAGDTEMLGSVSTNASIGTVTVGHPQVRTWPSDSYGERPANGYYVVVKVTAKADSSYTDGWFVSPPDFHAVVKGQHYDQDNGHAYEGATDAERNTDLSATLAAGETVTGYLYFDVPSAHGKIVYAPNSDGQPLAEWSY